MPEPADVIDWLGEKVQFWVTLATFAVAVATLVATVRGNRLARARTMPFVDFRWHLVSFVDRYLRIQVQIENISDSPICVTEVYRRSATIPTLGASGRATRRSTVKTLAPGDIYPDESDIGARSFRFTVLTQRPPTGYIAMDVRVTVAVLGAPETERTFFGGADVWPEAEQPKSLSDFHVSPRDTLAPESWYEESWRNRHFVRYRLRSAIRTWDRWGKGFHDWMRDFGNGV